MIIVVKHILSKKKIAWVKSEKKKITKNLILREHSKQIRGLKLLGNIETDQESRNFIHLTPPIRNPNDLFTPADGARNRNVPILPKFH